MEVAQGLGPLCKSPQVALNRVVARNLDRWVKAAATEAQQRTT